MRRYWSLVFHETPFPDTLRAFSNDLRSFMVWFTTRNGEASFNTTRRYSLKSAEDLAQGAERMGW